MSCCALFARGMWAGYNFSVTSKLNVRLILLMTGGLLAGLALAWAINSIASVWPLRLDFMTGQPALLYLSENNGVVDLWRVQPDGSDPVRLTESGPAGGVFSFDVSRDGKSIVLSVARSDSGAYLGVISRSGGEIEVALECAEVACVYPTWSPDGRWIAYEQRPLPAPEEHAGGVSSLVGEIWVLDTVSGESAPIEVREVDKGKGPEWSPDGSQLAFYETGLQAIVIYEFAKDSSMIIPNLTGERIAWSPDGGVIVFPEFFLSEEDADLLSEHADAHDEDQPHREPQAQAIYQHLVEVSLLDDTLTDLSGVLEVIDGTPVFSPDGDWLAFGRRTLRGDEPTFGRQLWLYNMQDGSSERLLYEPTFNHGSYSWSPDGTSIVYMRFDMLNPQSAADVWLLDIDSGEASLVAEGAFSPVWLP